MQCRSRAAGSAAAGDGAAASGGSAGPSVPSRESCFDRSTVAWRNTPECSQLAGTPIPSEWARSRAGSRPGIQFACSSQFLLAGAH